MFSLFCNVFDLQDDNFAVNDVRNATNLILKRGIARINCTSTTIRYIYFCLVLPIKKEKNSNCQNKERAFCLRQMKHRYNDLILYNQKGGVPCEKYFCSGFINTCVCRSDIKAF